jgi:hypothetical protein
MVREGLLEYDPSDNKFGITSKGLELLKLSEALLEYLPTVNQLVDKYKIWDSIEEEPSVPLLPINDQNSTQNLHP